MKKSSWIATAKPNAPWVGIAIWEDRLRFPFTAKCIVKRSTSPLKVGEEVEVVGMAPSDECEHDMFVLVRWANRKFGVPLSQLQGIKATEETKEAIEDWRYWAARGYGF